MNRKRILRTILLLVLVSGLVCGTAYALMFRQTQKLENQFDTAYVDCELSEVFDGSSKTSITVKNTGNIPAYIRVRFVTYWVDSEGNIVGKAPAPDLNVNSTDVWIADTDGRTFYCEAPVAPGEDTPELLEAPIVLAQDGEYLQVIEVFADAIQSEPKQAVEKSWKVNLNSDGHITGKKAN